VYVLLPEYLLMKPHLITSIILVKNAEQEAAVRGFEVTYAF
jgi:hypothetical protein